jgi:hypothetical protein
MEDKKLVTISRAILIIGTAVWAVMGGLISFANPSLCAGWIFEHYLGQSWDAFAAQQPRQAALYCHLVTMDYVDWLIGALFALFILFTAYRKANRSAWVILLAGTTLWAAVPIGFGLMFSDPAGIGWGIISLVVAWVALGIGAKALWSSQPAAGI